MQTSHQPVHPHEVTFMMFLLGIPMVRNYERDILYAWMLDVSKTPNIEIIGDEECNFRFACFICKS
jgi:hypothetical protein